MTTKQSIARLAAAALVLQAAAAGCSGGGLREELTEVCVEEAPYGMSQDAARERCEVGTECMLSRAGDYGISRDDLSEAARSDSWGHKPELDEYAWNDDIRRCVAARQRYLN